MGISVQTVIRKGKKHKERIFTIYLPTDERDSRGRIKYKRIVRVLSSVYEVTNAEAQAAYEREARKYKKARYFYSPLLGEFADRYLHHKRYAEKKKSWEMDYYALKALIGYFGEDTPLDEIDSHSVDKYKTYRQKTAKPKTVNNDLAILRHLYNLAIKWGEYSGENPVSRAGLIRGIVGEKRRGPTPEEESKIVEKLPPNIGWIFTFALYTGMRIMEVLNLKTSQIMESDYIENGEKEKIKMVVLDPTDTKARRGRVIPLNADAEGALEQALRFNGGRHTKVFLKANGSSYDGYNSVYQSIRRACDSLGIRRITPHDLRRGFVPPAW